MSNLWGGEHINNMHLIVIHKDSGKFADSDSILLKSLCAGRLTGEVILDGLKNNHRLRDNGRVTIAIPKVKNPPIFDNDITYYNGKLPITPADVRKCKQGEWFVISNGRFFADTNGQLIKSILKNVNADIIAVNTTDSLLSYREDVRLGYGNTIAGVRRVYSDSVLPCQMPTDWPCHIFIKADPLSKILSKGLLTTDFSDFVRKCHRQSLKWRCFTVGGTAFDLESETALLWLLAKEINSVHHSASQRHSCKISSSSQIFGEVMIGRDVRIEDEAVIVGPAILDDNVTIERKAVIRTSALAAGVTIAENQFVQNRVLTNHISEIGPPSALSRDNQIKRSITKTPARCSFRTWPILSYPICIKRAVDIIFAVGVLILFTPILPIIAAAIKLNSRGPVFFRHKRQGLYGKEFYCLKFRTMIVGADGIQEKLRSKNQVDGPQFKVENDPRVTAVGRFLRDTFIDEIPQFVNILCGQMSVVGPRPSPKAENSLCPAWRDARLSVRPGITGLWQIRRTRQPNRDFQEWIYYDCEYVRKLSWKLDLWICRQTIKKLTMSFARKF